MGRIITVMPVTVGAGGKYMATSIAYGLRRKHNDPRTKIALVDFDLHNPYLAASQISDATASAKDMRGVDSLLEKISSNTLTDGLFMDNMIKIEGQFDVLRGTRMPERYDIFLREHIETMIRKLKTLYTYVVICCSPTIDNAGTVFSLVHADDIVLVSRMNSECYLNFDRAIDYIKQCKNNKNRVNVVFNYRTGQYDLNFDKKIYNHQEDMVVCGDMKYYPFATDNQNIKIGIAAKLSKLSSDYNKQIDNIVNNIENPKVNNK